MSWQAILDDANRVVTVNNWEHAVGIPCFSDTPLGYIWNGTTFVPDPEVTKQELKAAVQAHLDTTVQTRNYNGILSCCSYASSTDQTFAAEGAAALSWRDAVWRHCYDILAAYEAGTRPLPTAEELIAELPALIW